MPYDIGLVKLSSSADYTDYVQAVEYATTRDTFSSTDECFISGWGMTSATGNSADTLKKSDMDVMTNSECAGFWGWYGVEIKDSHICINDHDWDSSACMGDSGGPLVCARNGGYKLAGLTSFGKSDCDKTSPNVYTRISSFRGWIDFVMEEY